MDGGDSRINDALCVVFGHHCVVGDDDSARIRVDNVADRISADKAVGKRLDHFFLAVGQDIDDLGDPETALIVAVFFSDNDVLRNVNQTSCEVAGVGGTESRIGKTLTGTSGGGEVFKNLHAFAEVCFDRKFDRFTGGGCHKSAHTGKLSYLFD